MIYYEFDNTEQDMGLYVIDSSLLKRMSKMRESGEFEFTTFDD
jgi:hypothetical protein